MHRDPTRPSDAIVRLGDGCYVNAQGGWPMTVDFSEATLLETFEQHGPALSLPRLIEISGIKHAHKVVKRLRDKFGPGAVRLPGRKSNGGYVCLVVAGSARRYVRRLSTIGQSTGRCPQLGFSHEHRAVRVCRAAAE
jgi:hypothetical protein